MDLPVGLTDQDRVYVTTRSTAETAPDIEKSREIEQSSRGENFVIVTPDHSEVSPRNRSTMPLLLFKSLTLQSFLNKNHPTLFPRVFGGFVQAQLVHSVFFEFCGEKHKNSFKAFLVEKWRQDQEEKCICGGE
jgi:hypothetical protein